MVCILVSALSIGVLSRGAGISDVALIVDEPIGRVTLQVETDQEQKANLMEFLNEGDRIELGPEAVVVLNYFYSGVRERIQGPGRVIVGLSASVFDPGMKVRKSPALTLPRTVTDSQQYGTTVLRGDLPKYTGNDARKDAMMAPWTTGRREFFLVEGAGPEKVRLLNLFQTAVSSVRPVFRWRRYNNADQYRVKLFGPEGRILLDAVTSKSSLELIGPDLKRGLKYLWIVQAMNDGRIIGEGRGEFRVLTREDHEIVTTIKDEIQNSCRPSSAEIALTCAFLCQQYLLYDEAAEALKTIGGKISR